MQVAPAGAAVALLPGRAIEPIFDYSTADITGSGDPGRDPIAALLRRLIARATPLRPVVEYLGRISSWPDAFALPEPASTDLAVYQAPLQRWGKSAPAYIDWARKCSDGCEGVRLGGPPLRVEPLRFYIAGTMPLPNTRDAWSVPAWQVALGVEQRAHMTPVFYPDRYQVGFCCGSPELAAEILPLILAENVEARLAMGHDDLEPQRLPCDVLLPVRPGATAREVEDAITAAVKATHTVLFVRA